MMVHECVPYACEWPSEASKNGSVSQLNFAADQLTFGTEDKPSSVKAVQDTEEDAESSGDENEILGSTREPLPLEPTTCSRKFSKRRVAC